MLPKIIIHNSISLDGSLTNFIPNMELHYQIAGQYKPDAHLIGSNTIKAGIELYENGVPPEETTDFQKPIRDENLPLWVIIDTKGSLTGLLHTCRRFEFCRNVIILVSDQTPKEYKKHLEERNYSYHIVGKNHVDVKQALELLSKQYNVKTILTDTGRILGNLLLNQGFVSEISLLIHPIIVGKQGYPMFSEVNDTIQVTLKKKETLDKGFVWLAYTINNK
jgi:2,5-diamino-6-(ribosylamino)-4(3H)-pyrimidinone 5'-phosphate reductase